MKIIVFTCDKYAHCIPIFYHFWKKNWPDCPYSLLIITGEQVIDLPDDPNVSIIYQGPDQDYASNAKRFLSGFPDELCLLILDDFIIRSALTPMIKQAERLCRRPDVGCVRINHLGLLPDLPFDEPDGEGFGEFNRATIPYLLSLQAAIWKTRVFRELMKDGECAWLTELHGTERARGRPERFLCADNAILDYIGYCTKGVDWPVAIQWARDHWDDPPRHETNQEA